MKYIGQTIVIMSVILMGACLDGYAFGMFGFGGLIFRLGMFVCTFFAGLAIEKKAVKRKRAMRAGTRKARKNNKYQLICHSNYT